MAAAVGIYGDGEWQWWVSEVGVVTFPTIAAHPPFRRLNNISSSIYSIFRQRLLLSRMSDTNLLAEKPTSAVTLVCSTRLTLRPLLCLQCLVVLLLYYMLCVY